MTAHAEEVDTIADCVLNAFDALPTHRKPRQPSSGLKHGRREWVPLAGIVIDSGVDAPPFKRFKCAALATGMKCLPQEQVHALKGNVVHDSHAEILALRAFNRFLLDCCADLVARGLSTSDRENDEYQDLLVWRSTTTGTGTDVSSAEQDDISLPESSSSSHDQNQLWEGQPFQLNPRIKIHMYCSEAPCGDASMELTMAAQSDATPWSRESSFKVPPPSDSTSQSFCADAKPADDHESQLFGRSYFDILGVVRRKPSRPDAPPTLSKSCSDKIALKQCTSTLSSITSILIHPGNAYISTLIMPNSQYIEHACERAWGAHGRMSPLLHRWESKLTAAGYSFRPFKVMPTTREFAFSRRASPSADPVIFVPSNLSSLAFGSDHETLINGVLQGRKQADPKGASAVSRRRTWSLALSIAAQLRNPSIHQTLSRATYAQVKSSPSLQARELSKERARQGPLRGWKRNSGDDSWSM